jgi:hypothetical protein
LELDGKGIFKGLPTTLHAQGGGLLSLRSEETPYPIKANGVLGKTKVSIEGMLLDPLNFKGQQLNFTLAGNDLAGNTSDHYSPCRYVFDSLYFWMLVGMKMVTQCFQRGVHQFGYYYQGYS